MKKLGIILVAAALLLPATAFSQESDSFLFNHLGLGVSAGIDGVGGQVSVTMGKHFQLRGGYSFGGITTDNVPSFLQGPYGKYVAPYTSISTDGLPDNVKESFRIPDGSTLDIGGRIGVSQFKLLADYFPFKSSSFHITAGAFFGNSHIIDVWAGPLPCDPAEYNNAYIMLGGNRVGTDPDGVIKADVRLSGMNNIVEGLKPYIGLGFGRGVPSGFMSFGLDLGALYNPSGFGLYTYDLDGNSVLITSDIIVHDIAGLSDEQIAESQGIIDRVDQITSFGWFPMVRMSLNFRLF